MSEQGGAVIGILLLLYSAKEAMQRLGVDQACEDILDSCIGQIRSAHAVSLPSRGDGVLWTELNIASLFRILEYVRIEIREVLGDEELSKGVAECIAKVDVQPSGSHLRLAH